MGIEWDVIGFEASRTNIDWQWGPEDEGLHPNLWLLKEGNKVVNQFHEHFPTHINDFE